MALESKRRDDETDEKPGISTETPTQQSDMNVICRTAESKIFLEPKLDYHPQYQPSREPDPVVDHTKKTEESAEQSSSTSRYAEVTFVTKTRKIVGAVCEEKSEKDLLPVFQQVIQDYNTKTKENSAEEISENSLGATIPASESEIISGANASANQSESLNPVQNSTVATSNKNFVSVENVLTNESDWESIDETETDVTNSKSPTVGTEQKSCILLMQAATTEYKDATQGIPRNRWTFFEHEQNKILTVSRNSIAFPMLCTAKDLHTALKTGDPRDIYKFVQSHTNVPKNINSKLQIKFS